MVPGAGTSDRWRLDGRIALVTGASAGLGARFTRVLHGAGAHVIATARRADRLEELARHCGNRIQTIADPRHRQAVIQMAAYNATKAALVNFTRHLAAVWGQDGVRSTPSRPATSPPS